ncbi:hypothetical protein OF83DRAFT_1088047 [Amylostereum chailletii]|nr:hypothetical protein OF83DRAFT_1088047 [Amylostereum chailletii]
MLLSSRSPFEEPRDLLAEPVPHTAFDGQIARHAYMHITDIGQDLTSRAILEVDDGAADVSTVFSPTSNVVSLRATALGGSRSLIDISRVTLDRPSHIMRLPNEMMIAIFKFCASAESCQRQGSPPVEFPCPGAPEWIAISQVSTEWRSLALACPDIWAIPAIPVTSSEWTRVILEQSGIAHLRAIAIEPDLPAGPISMALDHLPRIHQLSLNLQPRHRDSALWQGIPFLLSSYPAPNLEVAWITGCLPGTGVVDHPRPVLKDDIFQGHIPSLRALALGYVQLSWRSPVFSHNLTALELGSAETFETYDDVWSWISGLNLLEHLRLIYSLPSTGTTKNHVAVVSLPNLISFTLADSASSICSFLSFVALPTSCSRNYEVRMDTITEEALSHLLAIVLHHVPPYDVEMSVPWSQLLLTHGFPVEQAFTRPPAHGISLIAFRQAPKSAYSPLNIHLFFPSVVVNRSLVSLLLRAVHPGISTVPKIIVGHPVFEDARTWTSFSPYTSITALHMPWKMFVGLAVALRASTPFIFPRLSTIYISDGRDALFLSGDGVTTREALVDAAKARISTCVPLEIGTYHGFLPLQWITTFEGVDGIKYVFYAIHGVDNSVATSYFSFPPVSRAQAPWKPTHLGSAHVNRRFRHHSYHPPPRNQPSVPSFRPENVTCLVNFGTCTYVWNVDRADTERICMTVAGTSPRDIGPSSLVFGITPHASSTLRRRNSEVCAERSCRRVSYERGGSHDGQRAAHSPHPASAGSLVKQYPDDYVPPLVISFKRKKGHESLPSQKVGRIAGASDVTRIFDVKFTRKKQGDPSGYERVVSPRAAVSDSSPMPPDVGIQFGHAQVINPVDTESVHRAAEGQCEDHGHKLGIALCDSDTEMGEVNHGKDLRGLPCASSSRSSVHVPGNEGESACGRLVGPETVRTGLFRSYMTMLFNFA